MSASPKTSIYWIYHWGARTICNHSKQLVGEEALPAHWQVRTSCPGPDDFRPAGLRPRPCHSSASAIECGPLIEHLEISKIYFPQHPHIILFEMLSMNGLILAGLSDSKFTRNFTSFTRPWCHDVLSAFCFGSGIRKCETLHSCLQNLSNFSARPGLDSPAPGLHKCHRLPRYIRRERNGHHGHLPQVFVDKAQTNRQSKQKPQQPSMDDLGFAVMMTATGL